MTKQQESKVSHKIAKAAVCLIVLALSIPGILALTLASVVVWFYGEELLSGQVMKHFKIIEKFLPACLVEENV